MHDTKHHIKIEVVDLGPVKKRLNITIPSASIDEELMAAYKDARATAVIAGFRKGAVPLSIIKKRFGDGIRYDLATKMVEKSYIHAIQDTHLVPADRPSVDVKPDTLQEGKDFSYSVVVEVTPEINIDGYLGMELKKEAVEVTDKDVEEGLKGVQDSRAELKDVDRSAKAGDFVTVDFEASVAGSAIEGSKAADYQVVIGERSPVPGFDGELVGLSKGDKKEFTLKFPEKHSREDIAGKDGLFKVSVKSVKEKVLPVLDDEFAKDLDCDNLEQLRGKVREEVVKVKEANDKERLKNEILDKLIEKHAFEVPEVTVNRYLGAILGNLVDNMRNGIITPGIEGLSSDEMKAKYRDVALRRVKEDMVLDAIAAKEKVEVTAKEFEDSIRHLAASRNVPYESLLARIEREGSVDIVRDGLKHEKVFDRIISESKKAA